jgi:chitosanase
MITEANKLKIKQVINVFETGSINGDYSAISIFKDGPGKIRQITYGRSQTTEFGNLRILIQAYVNANGRFSDALRPFVNRIGQMPSLETDSSFKNLLKKAGSEDPIMMQTQDSFFDTVYWKPAEQFFTVNQFTLPLSLLVIYDSYIHSGGVSSKLRNLFPEHIPSDGGNEKTWIQQYVNVRFNWLANHPTQLLRNTANRPQCFKNEITKNNWDLSQIVRTNGVNIP